MSPGCALLVLQMLLYMARAYHDANQHMMAKSCLIKAIHLAPGSIKLHFDLAFVLQVLVVGELCVWHLSFC